MLRCRFVYDSTHFCLAECLCMSGVCLNECLMQTDKQFKWKLRKFQNEWKWCFSYWKFQRKFSYLMPFHLLSHSHPAPCQCKATNHPPIPSSVIKSNRKIISKRLLIPIWFPLLVKNLLNDRQTSCAFCFF